MRTTSDAEELGNDLNELRDKLANDFFDGDYQQADGAIIKAAIRALTERRLNRKEAHHEDD